MDLFLHYLRLPYLVEGVWFTLGATSLGLAGGLGVGLVLAAMQISRFWPLAVIARAYTIIFRGTPLILQLVFAYDALPQIGLKLSALGAAGLALAANEGPFIAEILRSGVLGVDRGQVAAGQALGMTPNVVTRRVIAPQAIRVMVPALGNECVTALKNSSLASVISVQELTLRSTQLASSTFDFFSIFFASGLMYLVLTGAISAVQLMVERVLDLDQTPVRELLSRVTRARRISTTVTAPMTADPHNSASLDGSSDALSDTLVRVSRVPRDASKRAKTLAGNEAAVEIAGLRKRYGAQDVLNGLDLTVPFGAVVALLGQSGSGKSTLLRCINHLESWQDGTVRVAGHRLGYRADGRAVSPSALANQRAAIGVGMVFQQFNLFSHLTARENVAGPLRWVYGRSRAEADRRATELLARVGLAHRAGALPRHLSGGQQQRVAIARALAPNPSVLLLDEPTSALDPELVGEVLEVIERLAVEDGLTMIISTHQLRFAEEIADRVIFLSEGAIIEDGPADVVLKAPCHPLTARFLRRMAVVEQPLAVVST